MSYMYDDGFEFERVLRGRGYNRWEEDEEEYEDIAFVRPDGDTEGKSISWCKSNGFFEIEEGVWSGPWYYEQHPEEHPDKKFPHSCPTWGCKDKYRTKAELERHLRMSRGKAHNEFRRSHGIESGPTKEEKEAHARALDERMAMQREEEYGNLLDELYGGFELSPYDEARIRKRLDEIQVERNGSDLTGSTAKKTSKNKRKEQEKLQQKQQDSVNANDELVAPAKKKAKQNAFDLLMTSGGAAKEKKKVKENAFDLSMKSGGVAKKKKKKKQGTVVTPPSVIDDGPSCVQVVFARFGKGKEKYGGSDDDVCVVGFEFEFSDGTTKKMGRTVGTKKSSAMCLEKDEYIVAIDTEDDRHSNGMSSVTLYTSHWGGRNVMFGVMGASMDEDWGAQFHRGNFNAKNGSMITSLKISKGQITSVQTEEVPKSGNRNWEDNWR